MVAFSPHVHVLLMECCLSDPQNTRAMGSSGIVRHTITGFATQAESAPLVAVIVPLLTEVIRKDEENRKVLSR